MDCQQNPAGVLNAHCYVISTRHGLVKLWAVGGLRMLISQALSASQKQRLLWAGFTHPHSRRLCKFDQSAWPACFLSSILAKQVLTMNWASLRADPFFFLQVFSLIHLTSSAH